MPGLSVDPLHVPKAPLRLRLREEAQARTPTVTIAELVRRSGLTRGLVERYWRNQTRTVHLDALALLADALDVPAVTLLTTTPADAGSHQAERVG